MDLKIFGIVLFGLIFLGGCIYEDPLPPDSDNLVCGNGICDGTEDCNTCFVDCDLPAGACCGDGTQQGNEVCDGDTAPCVDNNPEQRMFILGSDPTTGSCRPIYPSGTKRMVDGHGNACTGNPSLSCPPWN